MGLVSKRECGACNVCCKVHAILDNELTKPPGILCGFWKAGRGCMIYETRPEPCRGHVCAWLQLDQFDQSWRPDLSNIYIELKPDPPEHFHDAFPDAPFAFRFTVVGDLAPQRLGLLAATIASLVDSDIPVILAVPAPPEHVGCHMLLNPVLKPSAAKFGREYMECFAKALHTLLATPPERIVID